MEVWQDAYMRLEIDHERRLVRQTRSALSYEDIVTLEQSLEQLYTQMFGLDREQYVLLQDMRASRGRNDPAFEAAVARARPRMVGGFRRVAILVRTRVGMLQAQRLEQSTQVRAQVFTEEDEALRWLTATRS